MKEPCIYLKKHKCEEKKNSSRDEKKISILQKLKEKIFIPTKIQKKIFQLHENSNQKFSFLRKLQKKFSNPAKIQIKNF